MNEPNIKGRLSPVDGSAGGSRREPEILLHKLDNLPDRPQREEIIKGLLAAGEIAALTGPSGTGKSAIAARLVTSIAEGKSFFGRAIQPGPVVYVAAERYAEATRRLVAIRSKKRAPVYITKARPNLSDRASVERLAGAVLSICDNERSCPSLILFDTLARVMPGLDENSARDCGRVIENLTVLAELVPSAAVVFIHHTGKVSGEMRGSSALLAGVDIELRVEGGKKRRRLVVAKANAVSEGQVLGFRLVPIEYQEHPNADPESIITAELDLPESRAPGDHQDAGPARLSGRARQLLELIETIPTSPSGVEKREVLRRAREAEIFTGKSDASRVACDRAISDLVAAAQITLTDGRIHIPA